MTTAATLRTRLADLEAFVVALSTLLRTLQPEQRTYSGPPTYVARPGMEAEANRLRFNVEKVAGRAAYAFEAAGSFIDWKPRGTMQTQTVNPAVVWATILSNDPIVPLDLIVAMAAQAQGILEMKIEEEERHPTRRAPRVRAGHLLPVGRWLAGIVSAVIVGVLIVVVTRLV